MSAFRPHLSNASEALTCSGVPSFGVRGWLHSASIVEISERKCDSKGPWKMSMISSSLLALNSEGDFKDVK